MTSLTYFLKSIYALLNIPCYYDQQHSNGNESKTTITNKREKETIKKLMSKNQ